MTDFGRLSVVDVRAIWPHEAHDFTPWLADNLDALGDVLGIELELEQTEAEVGAFSVDILARDLGTDRLVVIENQFGSTDHDHLGKLLTYAAGYDVGAMVWLGESIREEHRQALDWLNQRTDTETHFFGVVVEVIRIDDSRPAFNLKPVVLPNEWQKERRRRGGPSVSRRAERYRDYFQTLIDDLREAHKFTKARRAQPMNWYTFSAGISGVSFGAVFVKGDRVRTELYIGTGDEAVNARLFAALKSEREALEREMGQSLEWEEMPDRQASRIAMYRAGSIDAGEATLADIRKWHIERLLGLKRVFGPRLAAFRATAD